MSHIRYTPEGDRRVTGGGIAEGGGPYTWGGDPLFWDDDPFISPLSAGEFIRITAPRFVPPDEPGGGGAATRIPKYSLDLCQRFVKIGEAEAYTFDAIIRHLAVGQWLLRAPLSGVSCPDTNLVDSIVVWDESEPARIVFAGIVRPAAGIPSARTRTLTADDDAVEWVGIDLFGILGQRFVWPTPAEPPPWTDGYDVRTGVGSTVAAAYISNNIGTAAYTGRGIPELSVIDAGVGTSGTWSGRMQPLDEFVARICRESGIGCVAHMPDIGDIVFTLRSPVDRSDSLVISDQGDLESMSRLVTPASATYVVGAGQGELELREFAQASTDAEGLDRVEQVYENTNISVSSELLKATQTTLALAAEDVSVDGAIAEAAAQNLRYLDDYQLGDWLGVEVDGVRYRSQVEAVTITLYPEREVIRPVLGRAATNPLLNLIRDVSGVQSRLDRQIA